MPPHCILHGDCLTLLPKLPPASVDLVLADPPYGTTQNKWDSIIPLEPLWRELRRVCRPTAAIVSSQGPQPDQQRRFELDDVVRLLPQALSLAEFYGDGRTAEALRILRQAIFQEGLVLHAHQPVQAIWASLGEEAKDRVRVGFEASRWKMLGTVPLATGIPARAAKLRAFGNSIVPQVAAEFIKAYLSCKP